jgi:small subunit ribosomal protein S16
MLSIRLSRVGTKKAPVYRIVVMPKHRDPWAHSNEILGHYNPRKNPRELVVKADRVKYWISKGAQATDTVWNLLIDEKIVEGEKRGVTHLTKKRKAKLEEKAVEQKAKAEEAKQKAKDDAEAKAAEEAAAAEAAKAEAEAAKAKAKEEAAAKAEAPAEEAAEEKTEDAPAEEKKEETTEEAPAEEAPEKAAEETPAE